MSDIWDRLINIQNYFVDRFSQTGHEIFEEGMEQFNQPGWINRVWSSDTYRRAHVDVVDARTTKGLWMMHCCIFPHLDDPSPIFGFDVVAGKNKITGCFHDFSSTGFPNHNLMLWFGEEAKKLSWRKSRELPEWAQKIFSPYMIAAGNINDLNELEQMSEMIIKNLNYYLENIGLVRETYIDTKGMQNIYCENQKLNPHTPKVMTNLGLNEDDVRIFIDKCLFPVIN